MTDGEIPSGEKLPSRVILDRGVTWPLLPRIIFLKKYICAQYDHPVTRELEEQECSTMAALPPIEGHRCGQFHTFSGFALYFFLYMWSYYEITTIFHCVNANNTCGIWSDPSPHGSRAAGTATSPTSPWVVPRRTYTIIGSNRDRLIHTCVYSSTSAARGSERNRSEAFSRSPLWTRFAQMGDAECVARRDVG